MLHARTGDQFHSYIGRRVAIAGEHLTDRRIVAVLTDACRLPVSMASDGDDGVLDDVI